MTTLTQSHVRGATDMPLIELTVGAMLDQAAARWGDHEAVVVRHQALRWTYAELQRRVDAFAAGLLALGLRPGDRIGIWSPNNIEWIITQFASAKAGLILVTINPAYRLNELEFALNKVGCKALVTAAAFKTSNYLEMLAALAPEITTCGPGQLAAARVPSLTTLIAIGADGHETDPLSSLKYSYDGYRSTPQLLGELAAELRVPVLMGGAGGYQPTTHTPAVWATFVEHLYAARSAAPAKTLRGGQPP